MKKKVLKKAQKGTQVNNPTFPAGSSRFMDAPSKPKPAPAPAKKETREERKAKQEAERLRLQDFDKKQPRLQGIKTGGAIKKKK